MAISHQEHRVIPVAPGTMSLKIFNLEPSDSTKLKTRFSLTKSPMKYWRLPAARLSRERTLLSGPAPACPSVRVDHFTGRSWPLARFSAEPDDLAEAIVANVRRSDWYVSFRCPVASIFKWLGLKPCPAFAEARAVRWRQRRGNRNAVSK